MMPELLHTFRSTLNFIEGSVADLSEEEMIKQPAGVPNHATWTLGHLIHSCQGIAGELGAPPWLPDEWGSAFGYGSTPEPDLSRYPSKSEMLRTLAEAADRLHEVLSSVSESTLKRSLPDEALPTMGHLLFQVVVAHTAFHAGELAVWRRAIGKQSAAVFV